MLGLERVKPVIANVIDSLEAAMRGYEDAYSSFRCTETKTYLGNLVHFLSRSRVYVRRHERTATFGHIRSTLEHTSIIL